MDLLTAYDSDDEPHNKPKAKTASTPAVAATHSSVRINAAPDVPHTSPHSSNNTAPHDTQLNLPLSAVQQQVQVNQAKPHKNHFVGNVERIALDGASFDTQYTESISAHRQQKRKSRASDHATDGDANIRVKVDKGKYDARNIDGYTGSWGVPHVHIDTDNTPAPAEIAAEPAAQPRIPAAKQHMESTVLHLPQLYDYQNRSYLFVPTSLHIPPKPPRSYVPKQLIHTYTGHSAEVNRVKFLPRSGHVFLSASNDCSLRIWSTVGTDIMPIQQQSRQCLRTIIAHTKAIRDVQISDDGTQMCSASYDKYVKIFDMETGECLHRIQQQRGTPNCVAYHPQQTHELLIGMSDRRVLQYDTRANEVVQTYNDHMGSINSVTFISNDAFVSTADDKRVYTWEYGIPVVISGISDPDMHSIPCIALHPNKQQFVGQSQDNTIKVFNVNNGKPKLNRRKQFSGHLSAGYACNLTFSPDGTYLASGDAEGRVFVWEYATTRKHKQLHAHTQVCIDVQWHPYEASKILTASWDGLIKYWD